MLSMFHSPLINSPVSRLVLHTTSSARHIHVRYSTLYLLKLVHRLQRYKYYPRSAHHGSTQKDLQLGTSPHNLSSDKPRGQLLIGRDGGYLNNLCRNAPTCRSADMLLHKIFQERRRCGWNRGKPDRKGRRKSCSTEKQAGEGQGFGLLYSTIHFHELLFGCE